MTTISKSEGTQVYQVSIKATPEAIWDAITKPEWNQKYGYHAPSEYRPASRRRVPGVGQRGDEGVWRPGRRRRR